MKIDIITIFPDMFNDFLNTSIIYRAIKDKKVVVNIHNLRDYTPYQHGQIDDMPYGGGPGMVLMVEPVVNAINALKTDSSKVIILTPTGKTYHQKQAEELTVAPHLIIICGHYEGFDERIYNYVDLEISLGDYILTGGELGAMVIIDSVTRLLPGVINQESRREESFNQPLLDYPVYTKPRIFEGQAVPDVLLSGHHQNINDYRYQTQIEKTKLKRPDLWREYYELQNK